MFYHCTLFNRHCHLEEAGMIQQGRQCCFHFFSLQKYALALCSIKATNWFWDEGEKLRHLFYWTRLGLAAPMGFALPISVLPDGWLHIGCSFMIKLCEQTNLLILVLCPRLLFTACIADGGRHSRGGGGGEGRGWGDFKHRGRKHEPALPWHTKVGKETLPMPSGNLPGTFALLLRYHNSQTMWKLKGYIDIFSWSYLLSCSSFLVHYSCYYLNPRNLFKKVSYNHASGIIQNNMLYS